MRKLSILLYSYKGKNLKQSVRSIIDNTDSDFEIVVIDQNSLNRIDSFAYDDRITYRHVPWDHQYGLGYFHNEFLQSVQAEYVLLLSDEATLSKGWDTALIDYAADRDIVFSGNGQVSISYKDLFSFDVATNTSDSFEITGWVSRHSLFGRLELMNRIEYPISLKYYGYSELCSLEFFRHGIEVCCIPKSLYTDLGTRNLEKYYSPFSLEHNYNLMVDELYPDRGVNRDEYLLYENFLPDFLELHGIKERLLKLPYPTNDVDYDPNKLEVVSATSNVQRQRFTNNAKGIA
jgi:glycosyltransferase involved in cell wall biosynthesis